MRFQILFESLSSINYLLKQFGLSDATEQLTLFRLWLCENFILQAPVVQTLVSAIHRINHYPADSVINFCNTYPLDSFLSSG